MISRRSFLAASAGAAGLSASGPFGREAQAQTSAGFWAALSQPGAHAIMRHALAPGGGDPADFALDDPTTQRRLSDAGRDQARAIGAAFRDAGVAFDGVFTSQWDRCRETAALLALGAPADLTALNSFFRARAAGPPQTAALQRFLETDGDGKRFMLVTHFVNIVGLLDYAPRSGEAVAFRLEAGAPRRLGTLLIPA